jgi:DNA-binding response OmpR family regulator
MTGELVTRGSARLLVVEDEIMIAMMIEDMLLDLGHEVVALATRLDQGLELAKTVGVDLAMLDVNLGGGTSFPIADVLSDRGIPFFFATGYGPDGLEERHRSRLAIKKPFTARDLAAAIERIIAV